MYTFSRMTARIMLALALVLPAAAQAQAPAPEAPKPVPPAMQDNVKEQQKRSVDQPGNNAPVWRDVRSGQPNSASIPGREVSVLVQPAARFPGQDAMTTAGEAWRSSPKEIFTEPCSRLLCGQDVIARLGLALFSFAGINHRCPLSPFIADRPRPITCSRWARRRSRCASRWSSAGRTGSWASASSRWGFRG